MTKLMDNPVPPPIEVIADMDWVEAVFSIKLRLLRVANLDRLKPTGLIGGDGCRIISAIITCELGHDYAREIAEEREEGGAGENAKKRGTR
ncbi:uncharacterized protein FMAN_12203 [Fusarium mangiferae]|uniref:Uncharacterized protein n=1 Tax=Fusarium mangiferae TaxID=192010 RepID=A0A1L7TMS3_FUSMA|nr:uncharacterized protein FMAN_12203 [Fusarium mangiferae]CVK98102.1 uncharacterized protein FMAN_12203 [Fusarium mangiferae]